MPDGTQAIATTECKTTFAIPLDAMKALLPVSSQDETRYNLNGIFVDVKNGKMTMVATDGQCLGVVEEKCDTGITFAGIITREALTQALKVRGKGKTASTHAILDGKAKTLSVNGCIIAAVLVEGHFPDWRQVVPKAVDVTGKLGPCFNLAILAKFDGLACLGKEDKVPCIRIRNGIDNLCPMVIEMVKFGNVDPNVYGVVMPMRM